MTDTEAQTTVTAKPATKRPRKMAREPNAASTEQNGMMASVPTKRESKADLVLGLLKRPKGATIDQLIAATGWLVLSV